MEELLQSVSHLIQELFFFRKRHVIQKRLTKSRDRKNSEPPQQTLARGDSALTACGDPSRLGNDGTRQSQCVTSVGVSPMAASGIIRSHRHCHFLLLELSLALTPLYHEPLLQALGP